MAKNKKAVVEDELVAERIYKVIDPENADRVLEILDRKIEFKAGEAENIVVEESVAKALKEKYPYLVIEQV